MSVYLYAFLVPPVSCLILPVGIKQQVRLLCYERLSAIVESEIFLEELEKTEEQLLQAVLAHDRTIRTIFEQVSLLPLRFGSAFASEESLLAHLQKHQEQYLKKLAQLKDKVEYIITFTPCPIPDESVNTELQGKAYLLAKKQRYQQQQAFEIQQQEQWERLKNLILNQYPDLVWGNSQGENKKLYLLVQRHDSILNNQQLPMWRSLGSHWEISLSELLPPYHFV